MQSALRIHPANNLAGALGAAILLLFCFSGCGKPAVVVKLPKSSSTPAPSSPTTPTTSVAPRVETNFPSIAPVATANSVDPSKLAATPSGPNTGTNSPQAQLPAIDNEKAAQAIEMYNRGVRLYLGDGVPQDFKEAAALFRQAADLNHRRAEYNLGVMYLKGLGVERDPEQAASWFSKAAEQGLAEAQFNLAMLYAAGMGVPLQMEEAFKWVRKAADRDHVEAQYTLATLYLTGNGTSTNIAEAATWYRKAAIQGHIDSQSMLGAIYSDGRGVETNLAEAVLWLRKAAEQDHSLGQANLARLYAEGRGVDRDPAEAYKWFELAASKGDLNAAREKLELSLTIKPAELAEGVQRATAFIRQLQETQAANSAQRVSTPLPSEKTNSN